MQKLAELMLQGNNLAYLGSGIIGFFILAYIVYNCLSYSILRERYHGIRFTTKNIAYITMLVAVSASVTIVVSLVAPVTVFPPVRIAIEGLMVKIAGFIFGPIVGVIVGLITEIIVMLFVPSFIHPAFIIVVICYGFVSGIGASFLRIGKGNNWIIVAILNIFLLAFAGVMYYIIDVANFPDNTINMAGILMSKEVFKWVFLLSVFLCVIIVWIVYIVGTVTGKSKKLNVFLPIMLFATASEYLVTALISAWGDYGFLGLETGDNDNGYILMFMSRLVQAPIKIIGNSAILYYTYKAVSPLIKSDR
ncbi:hypothetical protein SGLAD_v1c00290 [Spiroplasma gladiatoris]|uniref:ECF transporter S component n=1 Tax=Spiroplasma gladiatoris TaxID=2143 RepID=A0A4P7AIB3_9MOLU|nr:hypothetical protein [Spiroplasma gladiatoris]QBQ07230.1 hypothetical protein SGLAD_v1c00290 [Spiroplasma gladiatoris]